MPGDVDIGVLSLDIEAGQDLGGVRSGGAGHFRTRRRSSPSPACAG
ncbi:hypothetical protein OHB49_23930 [Streptomyces sp. NBC_01717]|nr:hypothetical protein [Streptomyces sp. NBC_01717]